MKQKIKNFFLASGSFALKLLIFAVVVYILFGIGKSIWKNWQVTQEIKKTDQAITNLEKNNENIKNQIIYFQTETFKELEARRRLGLKKIDENVVLIPENADVGKAQDQSTGNRVQNKTKEDVLNPIKWWNYIFDK